MFDFPFEESNFWTALYCIVFFLYLVWINFKRGIANIHKVKIPTYKKQCAVFLIAFFIVTHCYSGDFFHFMETVHNYDFTPGRYNYGEKIYLLIGEVLNRNYFLFRIVVWGGSFILFCLTAKRMNIPVYYAAIFLALSFSITFSYARVTAAMATFFYGLSFLCIPMNKSKVRGYFIGFVLIICSTYFHNSAFIMAILSIMVFLPLRKKLVVLIICLIPLLSLLLKDYFELFLYDESTDEVVARKMQRYSERELDFGISRYILNTTKYLSFYFPIIICLYTIFKYKIHQISDTILRMEKVVFGLVLTSTCFIFLGQDFFTFYYRILFMTMIPLCLISTKLYYDQIISRKMYLWCCIPGIVSQAMFYCYNLYCELI